MTINTSSTGRWTAVKASACPWALGPLIERTDNEKPSEAVAWQQPIPGANDFEYYGHHVPWAGFVMLRIGQQAKAHPHITGVLKTVRPRF
jgi:hypothetical protein